MHIRKNEETILEFCNAETLILPLFIKTHDRHKDFLVYLLW